MKDKVGKNKEKGTKGSVIRSQSTINRLKMYKSGKAIRNKSGEVIRHGEYQNPVKSGEVSRIEPNRKWFNNTRVISQEKLNKFVDEFSEKITNSYQVILKPGSLPISLLDQRKCSNRSHILDTEKYQDVFGKKSLRNKPKLNVSSIEELANKAQEQLKNYESKALEKSNNENNQIDHDLTEKFRDPKMNYGHSKRLWGELYKVIDSSDVLFQVLDARDPFGTRSSKIENYLKNEKPFKHMILILNKCDLVPNWVVKKYVYILSKEYPCIAFHADIKHSFGKNSVFELLRQFSNLHKDKKNISVGIIGYPNVGKSSLINTLKNKKVCNVAPIPGETKVWQYITLMKRIFLIDCPGVVPPSENNENGEIDAILKGVIRVEYIKEASDCIEELLNRVEAKHIQQTYNILQWSNATDLLEKISFKNGRLLKAGEPDINTTAKKLINDLQRGKLPYFIPPKEIE